ncbi:MAG: HU family DNA-binding protein [Proteobacteria bacterium]|nr:HU family DNA-binding protein [Pseudomonadota bacterium]
MNKNELIDRISQKTGLSKSDANNALDAVTDVITDAMRDGEEIVLVGFGSFKVGKRAARTGRHPKTGEAMQIAASKVVKFKVGKKLKDAVNV